MNQFKNLNSKISDIVGNENMQLDSLMKDHTFFKIGGPADILVTPISYEQVRDVIILCNEQNVPYFILGNGSNVLVKDGGFRGVIIKFCKLDKIQVKGDRIISEAGALLKDVSNRALENNLTGFEFASGIPGSVGGAAAMNAGAYGGEMCQVIEKAIILDESYQIREINSESLCFEYRNSSILKNGYIALEVTYALKEEKYENIKSYIDDLTQRRNDKQPLEYPSAGSTFKRPTGYYTGKLIEDCGLKGYSLGDAEVSKKHSGFIINKGNATANEILNLIQVVQNTVKDKYGVDLHPEVRIIGEDLAQNQ